MNVELLICVRDTGAKGKICSAKPAGFQWGKEELNTDKFAIATIRNVSSAKKYLEYLQASEKTPKTDKKYYADATLVATLKAAGGRKTILQKDLKTRMLGAEII